MSVWILLLCLVSNNPYQRTCVIQRVYAQRNDCIRQHIAEDGATHPNETSECVEWSVTQ